LSLLFILHHFFNLIYYKNMSAAFGKQGQDLNFRTLSCAGKIIVDSNCDMTIADLRVHGNAIIDNLIVKDDATIVGNLVTSVGGDLEGELPDPTVAKIRNVNVLPTPPTTGQVLQFTGTDWAPASLSGGSTITFLGGRATASSSFGGAITNLVDCVGVTCFLRSIVNTDGTHGTVTLIYGGDVNLSDTGTGCSFDVDFSILNVSNPGSFVPYPTDFILRPMSVSHYNGAGATLEVAMNTSPIGRFLFRSPNIVSIHKFSGMYVYNF
jgi:hypothetical protein